jgi:hypothetical protein
MDNSDENERPEEREDDEEGLGLDGPPHPDNPIMGHWFRGSHLEEQGRGIFTPRDREWIVGLREYDIPQQDSNVRGDVVDRIRNSLNDFELLTELDDTTRRRLYKHHTGAAVHQYLTEIIEFAYRGVDCDTEVIETAVTSAIYHAEAAEEENKVQSVDVDIDVEHAPNLEKAKQLLDRGEEYRLSLDEIGALVREGELDEDDLETLGPAFDGDLPENPFEQPNEDRS